LPTSTLTEKVSPNSAHPRDILLSTQPDLSNDWNQLYQSRLTSLAGAVSHILSGMTVGSGHFAGEPSALLEALETRKDHIQGVKLYHMNGVNPPHTPTSTNRDGKARFATTQSSLGLKPARPCKKAAQTMSPASSPRYRAYSANVLFPLMLVSCNYPAPMRTATVLTASLAIMHKP